MDEELNIVLQFIYSMDYYSVLKRNRLSIHVKIQMDLKGIMLSDEKNSKGYVLYLCNILFLKLEYSCFTMFCQFLLYNRVNQLYVHIYPLPLGPPSPHHPPSHPSRSSQSTELSSLCYTAGTHQLSVLHMVGGKGGWDELGDQD